MDERPANNSSRNYGARGAASSDDVSNIEAVRSKRVPCSVPKCKFEARFRDLCMTHFKERARNT